MQVELSDKELKLLASWSKLVQDEWGFNQEEFDLADKLHDLLPIED
jgi:hypothetical protein